MPFVLMNNEVVSRESQYSNRFLFWGERGMFRITNFRLSLIYQEFGSEQEETMPLENIDAFKAGRSHSPKLLIWAIVIGFLGFVLTVTLMPIVGAPLLAVGGLILLFWLASRRRELIVKSGNHEMTLDMNGMVGFENIEQLHNEIEAARIERLNELYQ